jgi:hypothetical protein
MRNPLGGATPSNPMIAAEVGAALKVSRRRANALRRTLMVQPPEPARMRSHQQTGGRADWSNGRACGTSAFRPASVFWSLTRKTFVFKAASGGRFECFLCNSPRDQALAQHLFRARQWPTCHTCSTDSNTPSRSRNLWNTASRWSADFRGCRTGTISSATEGVVLLQCRAMAAHALPLRLEPGQHRCRRRMPCCDEKGIRIGGESPVDGVPKPLPREGV